MESKLTIKYIVEPDEKTLARRAARFFVEAVEAAVARRGRARIAISGGSTPKAAFQLLSDPGESWLARMPWQKIELYWVDERCVPPSDPESNYCMTREALLDPLAAAGGAIPEAQIHRMEGELEPEVAAARYESLLRNTFRLEGAELPRFDLVALGMGADGHTASIFPHTEAIHDSTNLVVANRVAEKDAWRITLTWPVINQASEVFFLVAGAGKSSILNQVFTGPRNVEQLPSQLIRPAGGILTLILDHAAAALLPPPGQEGCGAIERER